MGIAVSDRKRLWGRARNQCAFPTCTQALIQAQADADESEDSALVLGEEAHIRSGRPGGPRFDPDHDSKLVDSYENLILLCPTHHTLVDKDGGAGFEVDQLIEMRRRHESAVVKDERLERIYRAYLADRYEEDKRVLFEAVDLNGPTVESIFVDVPIAAPSQTATGRFIANVYRESPGDVEVRDETGELEVAGGAQVFLHPRWRGNALIQGGPGTGKSTLLQYISQFHRSRLLNGKGTRLRGTEHGLKIVTSVARISIRVDLRHYADWIKDHLILADEKLSRARKKRVKTRGPAMNSTNLEFYLAEHVAKHSGMAFNVEDLVTTVVDKPVFIALDGLDEVANLDERNRVGAEIAAMGRRLHANACDLVVLVATRPGATDSALWSDSMFPLVTLRPLSIGLKVQYLNKWCTQANVAQNRAADLREKLIANQTVAHVRELGSNPMQLAILLHLLYRRGLLPQQRTELYQEYVKTFLDREEQDKEPLLRRHRLIIVQIHAYLAWYLQSQTELGNTPGGSISRSDLELLLKRHLAGSTASLKLFKLLLTAMTSRVLCLVERRSGYFEFEVQSLREYFAALYIYDESPAKGAKNSRDECLSALLERPYWSNVMRFFVGMLSKGEVKALVDNLEGRTTGKEARLDPYLRWVATQLLNDRVYENQSDRHLARIVDFVLEGSGVLLGEDGLLDSAGTSLYLSQDAGASHAAEHARRRLHQESDPSMRVALVACMARHGKPTENREWAWKSAPPVLDTPWIRTIADLRGFEVITGDQLERLVAVAASVHNALDREPLTGLLVRGGYSGSDSRLLDLCTREVVDGAGDLVDSRHFIGLSSPLRSLVGFARLDRLRLRHGAAGDTSRSLAIRPRIQDPGGVEAVSLGDRIEVLLDRMALVASDRNSEVAWRALITASAELWGDCWLTRQLVTLVPATVDLSLGAPPNLSSGALVREQAAWVASAREHAGESGWWSRQLPHHEDGLARRHWALGILAIARTQVVQDLVTEIGVVVDSLPKRHYRALRHALIRCVGTGAARTLNLRDPLRRRTFKVGALTASLLTHRCVASARPYLDKVVVEGIIPFASQHMIEGWMIARHLESADIKVSVADLQGARRVFSPGVLAAAGALPTLTRAQAMSVLEAPSRWPTEVVHLAAQKHGQKRAGSLPALAEIAQRDDWFRD